MNPYLSATLAMCVIVLVALTATAYMAVVFNRRAKRDLEEALLPLATVIDGDIDVEEALVSGRYKGHIAAGRMVTSLTGPGRVFQTSVIDGAGGSKWSWTYARSKNAAVEPSIELTSADARLVEQLGETLGSHLTTLVEATNWLQLEYDPEPGHIRVTAPMRTRRDIPTAERFTALLDGLIETAAINRGIQHPES